MIKINLQHLRAFIIVYIAIVHRMTKVHLNEVHCFGSVTNPCVVYPIFVLLALVFTVILKFFFSYPTFKYHSYGQKLFLDSELFL